MGLDLFCNSYDIKMGSYTTVHKIRKYWIVAYIKYLESTNGPIVLLYELKQVINDDEINYDKFTRISSDHEGFEGLKDFVDHSDCEGEWSYQEVESILETLELIRQYLKVESSSWDFDGDLYF